MKELPSALSIIKGKKSIILVGNHKEEGFTGVTEQIKNSYEIKAKNVKHGDIKGEVKALLKKANAVVVSFEGTLDENKPVVNAMSKLCKIDRHQLFKINLK